MVPFPLVLQLITDHEVTAIRVDPPPPTIIMKPNQLTLQPNWFLWPLTIRLILQCLHNSSISIASTWRQLWCDLCLVSTGCRGQSTRQTQGQGQRTHQSATDHLVNNASQVLHSLYWTHWEDYFIADQLVLEEIKQVFIYFIGECHGKKTHSIGPIYLPRMEHAIPSQWDNRYIPQSYPISIILSLCITHA